MVIERLSILGVGLLGGSLGLALKNASSRYHIVGYGHRSETLNRAVALGAIDEAATECRTAVIGADCVVLCTPVGSFRQILAQIGPGLKPGAIVTDVGSTKRSVVRLASEILPANVHFVGSHPMAGSEKRGVEFAKNDLFSGALCITTPVPQTYSAALESVEQLWRSVGMNVLRLSPEEHDRRAALVSHLPHAVAAALVALQTNDSLTLGGKGFMDATRIAAGDGALWRDIFTDNADQIRTAIRQFRGHLDQFESLLDPSKQEQLKLWLDQIATRRRDM